MIGKHWLAATFVYIHYTLCLKVDGVESFNVKIQITMQIFKEQVHIIQWHMHFRLLQKIDIRKCNRRHEECLDNHYVWCC